VTLMPLTPAAQGMLNYFNANPVDWKQVTPQEFRLQTAQMEQPADPADNVSWQDADANGVPVRIYQPAEVQGPLPTLVYFHGGGYISCGIASHHRLCSRLTRLAECAVVSVDYRLAPEHKFPAAVDDAFNAVRWAAKHGIDYGLDATRLAVGGDSAGGTLATVCAIRARDEGGPALMHQLLVYPGADLTGETESEKLYRSGYFLDADFSEMCLDAYLPNRADRAHPWASPLFTKDLRGLPPATIITAECDPLRDEGKAYADALNAAGTAASYADYAGVFHGFYSLFGMLPEADQAVAQSAATLKSVFAKGAAA
jgi:acetyl esterase